MNVRKMASLRSIDRRRFAQLCAGSLALAAAGCGRGRARVGQSAITVLYASDERCLGPAQDDPPKFLVFLPLVTLNGKGELEGRLAERWEHSPDYHDWTIHLRKGLRWQDGVPVTAHDVQFTLDLLSNPAVHMSYPDDYSVRVLDDHTYTIRYHNLALGSSLDDYTVYYPKHLLEKLDPNDFYNWEFWTHPVGNGPYSYLRSVPKTMMELEANPNYYRGKPKIERVVLRFIGPGTSSVVELMSGNVDATSGTTARFPIGELDPRFRVYYWYEGTNARGIYWQNKHPFFRDPRVRRALTLAINRRELLPLINVPADTALVDGPYTLPQLRRGQLPAPLPYDPEQARALLAAAGWQDRDGDGVRERDGKAFKFTAIVSGPPFTQIAVYVQDQFRRVGVHMDLKPLNDSMVQERLKSGAFEAAFINFGSSSSSLQRIFCEHSPIGYENPAVLALIQRAKDTADPDEEDRIYRELTDMFRADAPVTFLCPKVHLEFAHRRVKGLSSPWRANPVWYMEDLWLEDER